MVSSQPIQSCKRISKLCTMTRMSTIILTYKQITRTVYSIYISEGIPENLRKKIEQIQSNGGKAKLDL